MNSFLVFTNKEFKENLRSYKVLILAFLMILFGLMSPILAKIMPDVLSSMALDISMVMPEPTYIDAYTQFFKNLTQMGVIAVILLFSTSVSQERIKGTASLMLTKNLSRSTFLISKFSSISILWTITYFLSALITYVYTKNLFSYTNTVEHLLLSFGSLWVFVLLIIAITMFFSTLFSNSQYLGMLGSFGGWLLLIISSYIPHVRNYTPYVLAKDNMNIILGKASLDHIYISLFIGILCIIGLLISSIIIFKKQEI